jgi:hypothetical protein
MFRRGCQPDCGQTPTSNCGQTVETLRSEGSPRSVNTKRAGGEIWFDDAIAVHLATRTPTLDDYQVDWFDWFVFYLSIFSAYGAFLAIIVVLIGTGRVLEVVCCALCGYTPVWATLPSATGVWIAAVIFAVDLMRRIVRHPGEIARAQWEHDKIVFPDQVATRS